MIFKSFFSSIFFLSLILLGLCSSAEVFALKKIGEACNDANECASDNCQDSFCTCGDGAPSAHCAAAYGGTEADWKCVDSGEDPDSTRNEWNFCRKADYLSSLPKKSTTDVIYPVEKKILMGFPCAAEDVCLSANGHALNTCEETSIDSKSTQGDPHYDPWYTPGKKLSVCAAPQNYYAPSVCEKQYGTGTWFFTQGTGDLNGIDVCQKEGAPPITTLEQMRKNNMKDENNVEANFLGFDISIEAPELIVPETKIKIPGVIFSKITKESHITTDESGTTWLNIPFLGEYISSIYKYSVGLISLIAVMTMIISGVQIITSAGNSEAISGAKHRIISSVIAIILTAGSYTILYTVNPDLVNLKNLKILVVPGQQLEIPEENDESTQNLPTDAEGNVINSIQTTSVTVQTESGAVTQIVQTGADGPVTKKPTSPNEITEKEFRKDTINGIKANGWEIWQSLSEEQKNTVLPHLFIKTGSCLTNELIKTGVTSCGWKNYLLHSAVVPLFQQAVQNAQKYGFQLCPGSTYRDLDEETQLWNTGIVARFSHNDTGWSSNQGKIAKPSCTAPHSSGGSVDVALRRIGEEKNVTNFSGQMNSLQQGIAYYSNTADANVYATILEQIMYESGWVRYCQEKWHFEAVVTTRYSKWTNKEARCVMHWDNWIIPIPDAVKQKANTLTTQPIFP